MRFLSGLQPSGSLHLGNYFGAIKQHLELQHQGQGLFFIANYHALTSLKDGSRLRDYSYQIAAAYLALGLDINKSLLFRQSDVPEVTELAWILSNVLNVSVLHRAHAYKDKVDKGLPASVGLFTYPVLMAADILIFQTDRVPVGQDQIQHIEIAADLAASFNHQYQQPVFKIPEAKVSPQGAKVPGLDGQKMAKSAGNIIPIFENSKNLKKLVSQIKTDSKDFRTEALTVEGDITFELYSLLANQEEILKLRTKYLEDRSFGYGHAKELLFQKLESKFGGSVREHYIELIARLGTLEEILQDGATRARAIAQETIQKVRTVVGL